MAADALKLFSYWRSSAAYRVRIALNLKRLDYQIEPVHLLRAGGEQHSAAFIEINAQQLVPVLMHGQRVFRQSMAIIEYIDETWPEHPLMPALSRDRHRVRAIAQMVACDVHPLNNLRVMQYLENQFEVAEPERAQWTRHWIETGFAAVESVLSENPSTGDFCEGDMPTLADCCLIPQVYNAHRFKVDMSVFPTLARIERNCLALPAFDTARPEQQADAPT